MIRRDYILRMIEELRQVLAGLVGLKQGQRWQEVEGTVDEQFQRLIGAGTRAAVDLTETELLARLMQGEATHLVHHKLLCLVALFKEAGDAATAQDQPGQSRACYLKGMHLLLEALAGAESPDGPDFVPGLEAFVVALREAPLPVQTQARLMQHYERTGQFAKAEDALFAMLDAEPGNPAIVEFGRTFCERLQGQSDAALTEGGLPRPELDEALAELWKRRAAFGPSPD